MSGHSFRGMGRKRPMHAGAAYRIPRGGNRPQVPRAVTTATKQRQRQRGRRK